MLSIDDLTAHDVTQTEQLLVQMLQDEFPSMDLGRGRVLRELLIRPAAIFYALNGANMDELRRSMSLYNLSLNPALANDDIVDSVLSNLLLTRDVGANASGQIRVIVTSNVSTPVDAGAIFTANDLNFQVTRAFVGVTSINNVVNTGSRLITARADGNYEFLVDVEAVATGTSYNVSEGTRFITTCTIPRLVDLVSASDFTGGRATEDNAALAARATSGLSPRTLSGRDHIEALLWDNFTLESLSIIGFGDNEMIRDKHNMFELSQGGKVDIYARTAATPARTLVNVTATMLDAASNKLTVSLGRDTLDGIYDVLAVYAAGVTPFQTGEQTEPTLLDSLEIVNKSWAYNVTQTEDEFVPDVETADEAAFTRYRTMVLQFIDPGSSLTNGETATYQVYLLGLPNIAEIQDFVNQRNRRGPAADYLVRAPVPAMCSVGIQIAARNVGEVNTDAIKNAVASRVNTLGFNVGHLPGSVIVDAAQGQIASDAVLELPLMLLAKLYLPDGTIRTVSGTDELRVPSNLGQAQVSARTVAWYLRTSDIDVSVREIATPEV